MPQSLITKVPAHLLSLVVLLVGVIAAQFAHAAMPIVQKVPSVESRSYLLLDAKSGKVLAEKNADESLPPASLTKIMTSFVVATELAAGRIQSNDMVEVSVKAWRMGGSR